MLACALILLLFAVPLGVSAQSLPSSVDNSTSEAFPPVFNQIGGSCAQAATIGYMFTYEVNTLLGRDASIPENRFSYLYSWNFINGGRDEGSLSWDGINLSLRCGMMSEADFPSQAGASSFRWASGYDKYFRALHYRVDTFDHITVDSPSGVLNLKRYLFDGGVDGGSGKVVVFSSATGGWKMDDDYSGPSETGYHSILLSLPSSGAHAMTIVGYDDSVECVIGGESCRGAFIAVNSWGRYFHDRGHFYLPYHFFENPVAPGEVLSKEVTGISVKYVQPSLVYRAGLSYTSRNDLAFYVGAAPEPWYQEPTVRSGVDIAHFMGGDFPMQGAHHESDIEFAFDASSLAAEVSEMPHVTYFLGVDRNVHGTAGSGSFSDFAVYDYSLSPDPAPLVAEIQGREVLHDGMNWFALRTMPIHFTSGSSVKWLSDRTCQPLSQTLLLRTADGGYAKVKFSHYDREAGTIELKYVYSSTSDLSY